MPLRAAMAGLRPECIGESIDLRRSTSDPGSFSSLISHPLCRKLGMGDKRREIAALVHGHRALVSTTAERVQLRSLTCVEYADAGPTNSPMPPAHDRSRSV